MGRRAKVRRTVEEEAEAVGGGLSQPEQGYQSKLSEMPTLQTNSGEKRAHFSFLCHARESESNVKALLTSNCRARRYRRACKCPPHSALHMFIETVQCPCS